MALPHIEMVEPVNPSSRVKRLGFHKESGYIVVDFGRVSYHYKGSFEDFEKLRTADSPGRMIQEMNSLPYHKVGALCDCLLTSQEKSDEIPDQ